MKEKIYTIPVNEAFSTDCECPLCVLEKQLEQEALDYYLGPSLMEPDHRLETNKMGFCRQHFEMLYNRQENTLGLALILETHLAYQIDSLKKAVKCSVISAKTTGLIKKVFSQEKSAATPSKALGAHLSQQNKRCSMCSKVSYTMDRYMDVMFYLFFVDNEFEKKLKNTKGVCFNHLEMICTSASKYLSPKKQEYFLSVLMDIQMNNLERISNELNWFTKKFDYRNSDAPWKTSKDAVIRTIEKLSGYLRSKR